MLTKFHLNELPPWVQEVIKTDCEFCGAPIAQNENLTARWCPNMKCPGHMAYKLEDLAKYFKIKGIGPKVARAAITDYHLESHFDIMKFWFPNQKPLCSLAEIAALAYIDGYGKVQAERDLAAYSSFEDFFGTAQYINPLLFRNKDLLLHAQTYFRVTPPLSSQYINVMGTGSFNGYASREQYFAFVNTLVGDKLHVIQVGKRKTEVAFLIKEPEAVDHSKSATARECGIPIVTPMEFLLILCSHFHISPEEVRKKGGIIQG